MFDCNLLFLKNKIKIAGSTALKFLKNLNYLIFILESITLFTEIITNSLKGNKKY